MFPINNRLREFATKHTSKPLCSVTSSTDIRNKLHRVWVAVIKPTVPASKHCWRGTFLR